MSRRDLSLEERVLALEREVRALNGRINLLSRGVVPKVEQEPAAQIGESEAGVSDEMLTWAGETALFPRVAALCFLLVVALVLRTLTDSGVVANLPGAILGMGYAGALVVASWFLYEKRKPLAPVFAGTGALLMAIIVVETHAHFKALPSVPAYIILGATGAVAAAISHRFHATTPITLGTLAMCLGGAAIDYPSPYFPHVAALLIVANIFGFIAASAYGASWLRWILLAVTVFMYDLWALKLGVATAGGHIAPPELGGSLFFPMLAVMVFVYMAIGYATVRRAGKPVSVFEVVMLTASATGGFVAAAYVAFASGMGMKTAAGAGLVLAAVYGGLAFDLGRRRLDAGAGTAAFIFPAVALIGFSLSLLVGKVLPVTAVLAGMALVVALASGRWDSGGARLTSYVTALGIALTNIGILQITPADADTPVAAASTAVAGSFLLLLYRWCRRSPPPAGSRYFSTIDRRDLSRLFVLVGGLSSFFLFLRVVSLYLLQTTGIFTEGRFVAAQSVIINVGAAILMLVAYTLRDRELRNAALLVTVVGGIKVFLHDFMEIHGAGLVASVFSFGTAAAVESIILGKWPRGPGGMGKHPSEPYVTVEG